MIKVTDKYYVKVDDCYTVCERTISQSGKNQGSEVYTNIAYHHDMQGALNSIIRKVQMDQLKSDEIISLKDAIKVLVDIQKEFTDIVGGLENYE